jgi:hypothetical protein
MKLRAVLLALALGSCSPDAPAPAPSKPLVSNLPAPEPPPSPLPARPAPSVAAPKRPFPSDTPDFHVEVAIPLDPWKKDEEPLGLQIHLPAFSFRTMNHAQVEVFVNGDRLSTTPCLWSIGETIEFDPLIPPPNWPPPGAKFAGTTRRLVDNKAGIAEVYIARADEIQPPLAHLRDGEHVVYVKGNVGKRKLLGALRLSVGKAGSVYRYVEYAPVMDSESENTSRFQRTLWFERIKNEE